MKLTQEGFNNLNKKLANLEKTLRNVQSKKADALETGGNGWHDNADWEQLQQDEKLLVNKIGEVKEIISKSEIANVSKDKSRIQIGSKVCIKTERGTQQEFVLADGFQEIKDTDSISTESPLGKALLDKKEGDVVGYQTPAGEKKIVVRKVS